MVNITKVESLIKEKGWSKTYFCSLFNRSRTWIDDWKRERGLPNFNTLITIADKLDTTVEYLTDITDVKEKPPTHLDEKLVELITSHIKDEQDIARLMKVIEESSEKALQDILDFAEFKLKKEKDEK